MKMKNTRFVTYTILLATLSFGSTSVRAHCDGLDGPVVTAARAALESGNVKQVLRWVRGEDESTVRATFNETMSVRKLGAEAKALADRYFFETVVRIHRAGEGEPFTGLKPAGRDLGPAIPAADKAIESGSDVALARLLVAVLRHELREKFEAVIKKKSFSPDDVDAGREYVDAYVPFIHYVERLYETATRATKGHFESH